MKIGNKFKTNIAPFHDTSCLIQRFTFINRFSDYNYVLLKIIKIEKYIVVAFWYYKIHNEIKSITKCNGIFQLFLLHINYLLFFC